jgi:hypothetical protein
VVDFGKNWSSKTARIILSKRPSKHGPAAQKGRQKGINVQMLD